jgi:hypothetical protein
MNRSRVSHGGSEGCGWVKANSDTRDVSFVRGNLAFPFRIFEKRCEENRNDLAAFFVDGSFDSELLRSSY